MKISSYFIPYNHSKKLHLVNNKKSLFFLQINSFPKYMTVTACSENQKSRLFYPRENWSSSLNRQGAHTENAVLNVLSL